MPAWLIDIPSKPVHIRRSVISVLLKQNFAVTTIRTTGGHGAKSLETTTPWLESLGSRVHLLRRLVIDFGDSRTTTHFQAGVQHSILSVFIEGPLQVWPLSQLTWSKGLQLDVDIIQTPNTHLLEPRTMIQYIHGFGQIHLD